HCIRSAVDVDLETLMPQAAAYRDQAGGACLVRGGECAQIKTDPSDADSSHLSPAFCQQLGAPAAELTDQADSHPVRAACALVPDQEDAAGATIASHAQLQSTDSGIDGWADNRLENLYLPVMAGHKHS